MICDLVAAGLNTSQLETCKYLLIGMSEKQIAEARGCTVSTVKHSKKCLYTKFQLPVNRHKRIMLARKLMGL